MQFESKTLEQVKEYYGKVLKGSKDLQTSACCTAEAMPAYLRPILAEIEPEVKDRFYGCGTPIPEVLEGATVLDLGCGSGRDCYLLSKLVGPKGHVIGVDMTGEQLEVARKHLHTHRERFGYDEPNVTFHQGHIEDLASIGIQSNSVDLVVSNCVVNLSPDKPRVFSEIFRVLKPGGELYYSDVYSNRRVPAKLATDPVLLGECLGGSLYIEDFRRIMAKVGCPDYRVVSKSPITLNNPDIEKKIGMIDFYSMTIRSFKVELEDRCEDYGQVAYYLGTIPRSPHQYRLDDHHLFKTGMPLLVCSNTAAMLAKSRYSPHFKITGDLSTHYGLFDCGPTPTLTKDPATSGACC